MKLMGLSVTLPAFLQVCHVFQKRNERPIILNPLVFIGKKYSVVLSISTSIMTIKVYFYLQLFSTI